MGQQNVLEIIHHIVLGTIGVIVVGIATYYPLWDFWITATVEFTLLAIWVSYQVVVYIVKIKVQHFKVVRVNVQLGKKLRKKGVKENLENHFQSEIQLRGSRWVEHIVEYTVRIFSAHSRVGEVVYREEMDHFKDSPAPNSIKKKGRNYLIRVIVCPFDSDSVWDSETLLFQGALKVKTAFGINDASFDAVCRKEPGETFILAPQIFYLEDIGIPSMKKGGKRRLSVQK